MRVNWKERLNLKPGHYKQEVKQLDENLLEQLKILHLPCRFHCGAPFPVGKAAKLLSLSVKLQSSFTSPYSRTGLKELAAK